MNNKNITPDFVKNFKIAYNELYNLHPKATEEDFRFRYLKVDWFFPNHLHNVLIQIQEMSKKYFDDIDIQTCLYAGLFHDAGLVYKRESANPTGHENRSVEYAEIELKKHHERYYIAASPKKAIQELIYYLSSIEEGAAGLVPVHSLFFTNYDDFVNFNPKGFMKEIKKNLITLHGNFDIIKKLPKLPQKKLDPYFFVLDFEMTSRIKTFPRHLIRASAESLFAYLKSKYNIKVNDKIPSSISEVHKECIRLIKLLDERTYS